VAIVAATLLWADSPTASCDRARGHRGVRPDRVLDDYLKLVVGDSRGLIARYKYFWQSVAGLGAAVALIATPRRRSRPPSSSRSSRTWWCRSVRCSSCSPTS